MGNPIISFFVAGKPRGKGRPRFVRKSGHCFTPAATREAEDRIQTVALRSTNLRMLEGPLACRVEVTLGVPKSWPKARRAAALDGSLLPTSKPDVDNYLKMGITDSLNGRLWADDAQFVSAHITKRYGAEPGMEISIWHAGEQP